MVELLASLRDTVVTVYTPLFFKVLGEGLLVKIGRAHV